MGRKHCLVAEGIIASYHSRGADELVHRGLKDFGFEELPFLRFAPNASLYYTMVMAFFLFRVLQGRGLRGSDSLGGQCHYLAALIDVAAKIVRHACKTILKVAAAAMEQLQFAALWSRSNSPPQFAWA